MTQEEKELLELVFTTATRTLVNTPELWQSGQGFNKLDEVIKLREKLLS